MSKYVTYELAKGQESIGQALKVDFGDTASMKSNQEDN